MVHVVANRLHGLSAFLGSVGDRSEAFPLPHERGDEAKHGGGPDYLGVEPRAKGPGHLHPRTLAKGDPDQDAAFPVKPERPPSVRCAVNGCCILS